MSFVPASNCSCHDRSNCLNVGTFHLFTFLHPLRKQGVLARFFFGHTVWEEKTATLRFVIGFFHFMKPLLGLGIVASMLLRFFRKRFTVCVMLVIKWDIQCLAQVLPYIQLLHNINRLDTYMKKCTYCMHTICAGSILDCLWSLEGVETVSLSPFLFGLLSLLSLHGTYQNSSHMSPADDRCRSWGVDRARALLHCNAVNLRSEPGFLRGFSGWVL